MALVRIDYSCPWCFHTATERMDVTDGVYECGPHYCIGTKDAPHDPQMMNEHPAKVSRS